MNDTVRETKRADELKPGDWIAPHELLDGAAEVLFVLAYPEAAQTTVYAVVRKQGAVVPYTDFVPADMVFKLATEADLAELREQAERAQQIADIRAFAAWLEANPSLPMPNFFDANAHLDQRHLGGPGVAESYAEVHRVADQFGLKAEERLADRTTVSNSFGRLTYQVIAWHPDGRPAEPKPDFEDGPCVDPDCPNASWPHSASSDLAAPDPTGQLYSREADDPTPVSGARIEPHVGGMTEGGLVDETLEAPTGTICGLCMGDYHGSEPCR